MWQVSKIQLTTDLILHGKIETTEARAKEVKAIADSIISLAIKEKNNFETVDAKVVKAKLDSKGNKVTELVKSKNGKEFLKVVKEETTAQENDHFIIERSELPADSIKGILKVKVKKTPELENHNLVATFRLCGNENFAAAPVNENTYKIVLTNHLTEPAGWPFGEYSRIKHQFVIQTLGIATDYDKWSTSETIYYTGIMINALYEYNKAHPGEPLTDENGLVVTF